MEKLLLIDKSDGTLESVRKEPEKYEVRCTMCYQVLLESNTVAYTYGRCEDCEKELGGES